jgi:magnesium chelatase subunit I
VGIIPSITGKIELVYEGEQEGPYQVAMNLLDKSIRSQFAQYFPNPDQLKKRKTEAKDEKPHIVPLLPGLTKATMSIFSST